MYKIEAEDCKIHWTNSESLARQVADDLKERYNKTPIIKQTDDEVDIFYFDPGGSIYIGDKWLVYKLDDGLQIMCRSQHWEIFCSSISYDLEKRYYSGLFNDDFFKLHGYMHILCLSEKQKSEFLRKFREQEGQSVKMAAEMQERIDKSLGKKFMFNNFQSENKGA